MLIEHNLFRLDALLTQYFNVLHEELIASDNIEEAILVGSKILHFFVVVFTVIDELRCELLVRCGFKNSRE